MFTIIITLLLPLVSLGIWRQYVLKNNGSTGKTVSYTHLDVYKRQQYDRVERYELNAVRHEVSIGGETYKLSKDTQYFSQGHSIEEIDLNPSDILTFHGIDSTVLSVVVEKGHGYLRLVNDENFVGGWLEIGQTQIVRITEDMLVTVPEGS